MFTRGPLDVLDHSSDNFSFGGKVGVDATIKLSEENSGRISVGKKDSPSVSWIKGDFLDRDIIKKYSIHLFDYDIPILILAVNPSEDAVVMEKVKNLLVTNDKEGMFRLVLAVDHTVDPEDLHMVAWQLLGNTDPDRDHAYISPFSLFIDGTIKAYRKGGFPRKWPNVVCSSNETISAVDRKWESLGIGDFINSPSVRYLGLCRMGSDEIIIK
jgi:4-hydroxy-3-polyprenylbenzoate decarboxylase